MKQWGKSFLVCGITNTLDGSESHFIPCSHELPNLHLPYVDKSNDPFFNEDISTSDEDSDEVTKWFQYYYL